MPDIVQRVACKAVIVKEGKVLVLREATTYEEGTNHGRYHFPGGRINPGEPFQEGLLREVKEETGLEVQVGEPFFVGEWFPIIRGVKNHIVAIFFLCDPLSDQIILSEEHDDYKWVGHEDMKQIDVMVPDDQVLEKFFQKFARAN